MGIIRKLPDTIANKIAAGEVIERPASIVKELVENAIDAEASRIVVELEDGGKRLIRVSDDGTGMSADDLEMAVQSHATSKLKDSSDLFFITTLGFRGEALPSVGAVSEMTILSRLRGATAGAQIDMAGGRIAPLKAAGVPEGTIVEARNLFFNIPARRKFLRTTSTELSHAVDIITKMGLAYPSVSFRLTHNGHEVLNCLPNETRLRRISNFFGKELQGELLEIASGEGPITLNGFIAPASQTRSTSKLQYVFLNGRFIRDKSIASAVRDAYEGLLPAGRQPIVILFLQIDPREVDVNVHPTKHEVRFRDSHSVYVIVRTLIRDKLGSAAPTRLEVPAQPSGAPPAQPRRPVPADWDRKISRTPALFEPTFQSAPPAAQPAPPPAAPARTPAPAPRPSSTPPGPSEQPREQPRQPEPQEAPPAGFQVHDTYLIEDTPDGIRIIDQHALHERVLYNQIRKRLDRAPLESQRLLIPVTVELSAGEVILLTGAAGEIQTLGFEIEEFGRNTVALRTMPVMLLDSDAEQVLHDLIAQLQEGREAGEGPQLRESLMRMIACKAAVKARQRLSPAEVRSLLRRHAELGPTATCPHGRPISLTLSLEQLEKHFLRR